jgi:hypothetical protein
MQSDADRSMTRAQLEVIEYIRNERREAALDEIQADEGHRAAGVLRVLRSDPEKAEYSTAIAGELVGLGHIAPPRRNVSALSDRPRKSETDEKQKARERASTGEDYLALARGIIGSNGSGIAHRKGSLTAAKTERPNGARFTFNVPGATGEGRSARLPSKHEREKAQTQANEETHNAIARAARRAADPKGQLTTYSTGGIEGAARVSEEEFQALTQVPDKTSVVWLKAERNVLRRKLADGTATIADNSRLAAIVVALKKRKIFD